MSGDLAAAMALLTELTVDMIEQPLTNAVEARFRRETTDAARALGLDVEHVRSAVLAASSRQS